jgi:YidC/Oxa1 family membrane protein insertase
MARRTPGVEVNAQQQAIMRFMPLLLPVISFSIPAGVVVYFLISNLYRVGQQAYIQKTMHGPAAQGGADGAKPKDPKPAPRPATEARVVAESTGPGGGSKPVPAQRPRKKKKKR